MRTQILTIICLAVWTGAMAQSASDSMRTPEVKSPTIVTSPQAISYSGGYGHFFTGPAWIEPTDLVNHLMSPEVFGSSLKWNNLAITAGAEGFAELHRLLVGFGAFGLMVEDMDADSGTVRFAYGGGLVKVGYAVYQKPRYFASIIAGFGGGLMYVGIDNTSKSTPIYFSSTEPVYPNKDQDYYRGYLLYDLAISNKFIATAIYPHTTKYGGFMIGLDIGASFGIPVDTWRDDNSSVTGIPNPGSLVSPYLRLTIGGGGFRKQQIR